MAFQGNQIDQNLASVLSYKLPGGHGPLAVRPGWSAQPVVVAVVNQRPELVEVRDLPPDAGRFLLRDFG